jgi:outer membrane murein-binding lipoprotein Lpp
MNALIKFSCLLLGMILLSGCTNTAKIDSLHARINTLEKQLATANAEAAAARKAAGQAESLSQASEAAASRAAEYSKDTGDKLDQFSKRLPTQ